MPRRRKSAPKKRRPKGTGTLRERKDGRWEWIPPPDVDPLRKSRYYPDQASAERESAAELERFHLRKHGDPHETVQAYLERWLSVMAPSNNWGTVTVRSYRHYLLNYFSEIGSRRLTDLTPAHIQQAVADLTMRAPVNGKRPGARMIGRAVRLLKSALETAVDWELIDRNPVRAISLPRPPRASRPTVWTVAEIRQLLRAAAKHPRGLIVVLGAECGFRMGEIAGLRWIDFDEDARTLKVARQVNIYGEVKAPKYDSDRPIPLSDFAYQAIIRYRASQRPGAEWVFEQPNGKPLSRSTLTTSLRAIVRSAGIRELPPHSLRHFHSSYLLAAGVSGAEVAKRLGHSSPQTTHAMYDHVISGKGHERAPDVLAGLHEDPK